MLTVLIMLATLFQQVFGSVCPPEWISSPSGASWGNKCYKLTAKPASHRGCAELCGAGSSLVCIHSKEENEFLKRHVAVMGEWWRGAWIGLYQWPFDQGTSVGWDLCVNGEASTFKNWVKLATDGVMSASNTGQSQSGRRLTHMSHIAGDWSDRYEDCAGMTPDHTTSKALEGIETAGASGIGGIQMGGEWFDAPCNTLRKCLCARDAGVIAATEPILGDNYVAHMDELHMSRWSAGAWQQRYFSTFALSLLPTFGMAFWWLMRRCCHRNKSDAEPTPSIDAKGANDNSWTARQTLLRAEKARAALRARVSFISFQSGWLLLMFCYSMVMGTYGYEHINLPGFKGVAVGTWVSCLLPISVQLMLLALLPTDRTVVDIVCVAVFLWCSLMCFFAIPFAGITFRTRMPIPRLPAILFENRSEAALYSCLAVQSDDE